MDAPNCGYGASVTLCPRGDCGGKEMATDARRLAFGGEPAGDADGLGFPGVPGTKCACNCCCCCC